MLTRPIDQNMMQTNKPFRIHLGLEKVCFQPEEHILTSITKYKKIKMFPLPDIDEYLTKKFAEVGKPSTTAINST